MEQKVIILACSIFRNELDFLNRSGKIDVPIVYLNSMLHMQPAALKKILDTTIKKYQDYQIILMYGDCHARMLDYEKNSNVIRSPGINCCEIVLGAEKFRSLRKEGAFILLPEWIDRWKEVFVDYMGFNSTQTAQEFMNEMHSKLVFVDSGLQDRTCLPINEISDYLGLPVEYCLSSTSELEKTLNELLIESKHRAHGR